MPSFCVPAGAVAFGAVAFCAVAFALEPAFGAAAFLATAAVAFSSSALRFISAFFSFPPSSSSVTLSERPAN